MTFKKNINLLKHQKEGIEFMSKNKYVINADEQGLGKTLQAMYVADLTEGSTLVISPATLKLNWKEEYEKFTDIVPVVGLEPSKVNIVNYEMLYLCTELFKRASTVIIDEAHYLIHMDSQRTEYVHRFIKRYIPERLILLTGTPLKNRVSDCYSLLSFRCYSKSEDTSTSVNCIRDKYSSQEVFNDQFSHRESFKVKVKGRRGSSFYKQVVKHSGIKNVDELKQYFNCYYIRRLAKNVLDLPALRYKDIPISGKTNKKLLLAFEQYLIDGEKSVAAADVKREAAEMMAPNTAKYVQDLLDSGEKCCVVFSDHVEPLSIIASKFKKLRIGFIKGSTSMDNRHKAKMDFQEGKLDLLLCTVGAANAGITLTRSRNIVLNDEPWDYAALSQLVKRIHRIGQKHDCLISIMVGSETQRKIRTSLDQKRESIKQLIEQGD